MEATATRLEPTFVELAQFAANAYRWTAAQPFETTSHEFASPGRVAGVKQSAAPSSAIPGARSTRPQPPDLMSADELAVYRGASVAAAVLQTSERTIIAAPGSLVEPHDWVANFDARQINLPSLGSVHFGFWVYADALWRNFLHDLAAKITTPIYMCGHSQGGAVAAIIGHYLARLGKPPRLIATFGAPRFLHAEAAARYRLPLVGFRNAGDPVPLFPCGWLRSYASAGRCIRLEADGSTKEDRHSFWKSLHYVARRLLAIVGLGATTGPITSHSMAEYIARLRKV